MGLWDLFKRAACDDGTLLTLLLSIIIGAGKPTIALIYSNC
jgi:hypothetical protein